VILDQLRLKNKFNLTPDQLESIETIHKSMIFSKSELEEMRKIVDLKRLGYEQFLWVLGIIAQELLDFFVKYEKNKILLLLKNDPDWKLLCPDIPLVISNEQSK
jgi:hypothetical protein